MLAFVKRCEASAAQRRPGKIATVSGSGRRSKRKWGDTEEGGCSGGGLPKVLQHCCGHARIGGKLKCILQQSQRQQQHLLHIYIFFTYYTNTQTVYQCVRVCVCIAIFYSHSAVRSGFCRFVFCPLCGQMIWSPIHGQAEAVAELSWALFRFELCTKLVSLVMLGQQLRHWPADEPKSCQCI